MMKIRSREQTLKFIRRLVLLLIVVVVSISFVSCHPGDNNNGSGRSGHGSEVDEDVLESEVEDVDDGLGGNTNQAPEVMAEEKEDEDMKEKKEDEVEDEREETKPQLPNIETFMLMQTKQGDREIVAGEPVQVISCIRNLGEHQVLVESIEASFHYPQDHSYYVQNFTATKYDMNILPLSEASFDYRFQPHESYGGRLFGVTIMAYFKHGGLNRYNVSMFNQTVTLKEMDIVFDLEEFVLYLMLIACACLLVFTAYYYLNRNKPSKNPVSETPLPETGTQTGKLGVDFDWLPTETTTGFHQSKSSSRRSRRVKKGRINDRSMNDVSSNDVLGA